jgi:hypothetical protein
MKRVVLAALAALMLALPAVGQGKPSPLNLGVGPSVIQRTSWISQQDDVPQPADFIRNSVVPCFWSVNDHAAWHASGYLDAGASASTQVCIVSDFNPVFATKFGVTAEWSIAPYGFFGATVSDPMLDTSVCYSPQERCFSAPFCGRANYDPDDPALSDIVDSHGGRGVTTTITLTVSNPTSRRIRDIDVNWGISSDVNFHGGCTGPQSSHLEYPFAWS